MEEALRRALLGNAAVAAAFGTRIDWGKRQSPKFPALELHRAGGGEDDVTMDGASGFNRARVQLDTWARTYGEARSAARAVRAVLAGITGLADGVRFRGAFVVSEDDGAERDSAGPLHRVRMDAQVIWHTF